MITPHQATALMREHSLSWQQARTALADSHGRYLAEDLIADRDGPPFHRVAMDGIAISIEDFHQNGPVFKLDGMQAAGSPQLSRAHSGQCLEAMTGAVLPENCDAVIPFERCNKVDEEHYRIDEDVELKPMLNIHTLGCDFKQGQVLLKAHQKLRAPEIAVAASLGCTHPLTYQAPSIGIITTGSELVDVSQKPLPHQIRKSNIHAAAASLKNHGFQDVHHYHIPDNLEDTIQQLGTCLEQHDVLILSGGVSKGKLDFVPDALTQLGVEKHFHRIAQKPGKPMWFGTKGKKCIYALPGNPVSLLVCLRRYVIPALNHQVSPQPNPTYIELGEDFKAKAKLCLFAAVSLKSSPESAISAYSVSHHGSGDYASLTHSEGFVELAASDSIYPAGTLVPYYSWEQL